MYYQYQRMLFDYSHSDNYFKVPGKLMRLNDINELKVRLIDFIKCDVEDNELYMIKSGKETISHNLPVIFLEILRKFAWGFNYSTNDLCFLYLDKHKTLVAENYKF